MNNNEDKNNVYTSSNINANTCKVKIKKLNPKAKIPTHGSAAAAGYDLYACLDTDELVIGPFETKMIGTGIALELPTNTHFDIYARSGLATKKGLRPANCVGLVDEDYRGEIKVALHNDQDDIVTIEDGERIAQGVLYPTFYMDFDEVEELDATTRGNGGFGSTGTK